MLKKILFISLLCPIIFLGQELEIKNAEQNNDMFSNFMRLSSQQLLDTARYYFRNYNYDTAIIGLDLLINTIPQSADLEQQKIKANAYNILATMYLHVDNYRNAYDFYIKALQICEKYQIESTLSKIYINIGALYHKINQYNMAKQYYLKALDISSDSAHIFAILNNLGDNEIKKGEMDSAYFYIDKALKLNKLYEKYLYNTLAKYFQNTNQYDSASYYFHLSLNSSKELNDILEEVESLYDLGKLFFEINKIDSALYYIEMSNKISFENKFSKNLSENYLILSEIEKSKGRYKKALEYYETYNNLKDSIYNAGVYGSINLTQRQYEISKKDEKIEELTVSQQIKDNTIHYQNIIQRIIMSTLFIMLVILGFVLSQNYKLRMAYKALVKKNVDIFELQKKVPEPKIIIESDLIQEQENLDVSESFSTKVQNSLRFTDLPLSNNDNLVLEEPSDKTESQSCIENEDVNLTANKEEISHFENQASKKEYQISNKEEVSDNNEISDSEFINTEDEPETSNSVLPETKTKKNPACPLSDEEQNELLKRILAFMENIDIICNQSFTLNKLAEMVNSNQKYISYVINRALNKNFRAFLNSYRIKEAQKQLKELDTTKFTIGSVGLNIGFKSKSSFYATFKETTGVNPFIYHKFVNKLQDLPEGTKLLI